MSNPCLTQGIAASSRFLPTDLPDLVAWFDADDAATITISTGVSNWRNKGSGADLTQGTGANQPLVASAELNGRDVLRFDGSNDLMSTSALGIGTVSTIFAVLNLISDDQADLVTGTVSNATSHILYRDTSADKFNLFSGANIASAAAMTLDQWYYLTAKTNGASSLLRVDGDETTGDAGSQNWASGLRLGATSGGTSPHETDYAEVLVYDRALDAAEITKIETYLAAKWGL